MNVTAAGNNLIVTEDEEDSILRDWFGERLTDSNGITRDWFVFLILLVSDRPWLFTPASRAGAAGNYSWGSVFVVIQPRLVTSGHRQTETHPGRDGIKKKPGEELKKENFLNSHSMVCFSWLSFSGSVWRDTDTFREMGIISHQFNQKLSNSENWK